MHLDPLETTRDDGAACYECGDDAVIGVLLQGHTHDVPLCGNCAENAVTDCAGCDQAIWSRHGIRLFSSSRLYCQRCVESVPGMVDYFNLVRR